MVYLEYHLSLSFNTILLFPSTMAGMQGQGAGRLRQVLLLAKKAVDEN